MKKLCFQSLSISSLALPIAIFKKGTCQPICILSTCKNVFMKFTMRKSRKARQASFQIVWHNGMPKQNLLPQLPLIHYQLLSVIANIHYWKMKSSKQVHFINIRLFDRIFYKTDFIHLFEIFFGCYDQNTMFSVRSGACYSIDKRDQNNSHNDTFFQNCGLPHNYLWVENVQDKQNRSGKDKKSEGCCWE